MDEHPFTGFPLIVAIKRAPVGWAIAKRFSCRLPQRRSLTTGCPNADHPLLTRSPSSDQRVSSVSPAWLQHNKSLQNPSQRRSALPWYGPCLLILRSLYISP